MRDLLAIVGAYVIGSIPFALLVSRRHGVDVRRAGSGNVGATNVLRTVGTGPGMLVMLLDIAKGAIAVVVAQRLASDPGIIVAAGLSAIAGHVWPVWLRFRGGKGVATGAGVFGVLMPQAVIVAVAIFAITVAITRYMSLGSIVGALTVVSVAFAIGARPEVTAGAVLAMVVIVFRHRANLGRLIAGTEPRLGQRPATDVTVGR
jgi:glycerol-3-phosphate acyltransferase PlsY